MYKLSFNIRHGNSEKFLDQCEIEAENKKDLEEEFFVSIMNSYDNALNLLHRKLYPTDKLSLKLEYVESNFLNDPNHIVLFLEKGNKYIFDLMNRKNKSKYFSKKTLNIKPEYLIESIMHYSQLEKIRAKVGYTLKIWEKEKKEFIDSVESHKPNKKNNQP